MVDGLVTIQSSIAEGDQKAFGRLHQLFYKRLCQFANPFFEANQKRRKQTIKIISFIFTGSNEPYKAVIKENPQSSFPEYFTLL